jgi:hypothetical protein
MKNRGRGVAVVGDARNGERIVRGGAQLAGRGGRGRGYGAIAGWGLTNGAIGNCDFIIRIGL